MEYLIIAGAVLGAAWMFRNALKDVFGIFRVFRQIGVRLFRLVTPNRALQLGEKNRSPAVADLLEIQGSGDVNRFASAITAISDDAFAEYLHVGVTDIGQQYGEAYPAEVRAQIVHAAHLIHSAKAARGKAAADRTATGALRDFDALNQQARDLLDQVVEKMTTDLSLPDQSAHTLAAHQLLIQACRGTNDKARATATFESALDADPSRLDIQVAMLNLVSARWTGNTGEALQVATRVRSVSGHNPGIVAAAHIEHWMDQDGDQSSEYFSRPAVLEELDAAYQALPQRIDSTEWLPNHQQALALNAFALCFSLANRKAQARKVFARIGDRYTAFPWQYVNKEPQVGFLQVKDSNL